MMRNAKPELMWIKIERLFVPTDYQRSVKSRASQNSITRIQKTFSWAECGALIVCAMRGVKPMQYAVIDGQHRYKGALANGNIPELPCVVIHEDDIPAQARTFIAINENRVNLHILHKYQAMITSGDPDAIALESILKKCQIAMAACAFTNGDCPPNVTMAAGTLIKMMTEYSEKQIVWGLTCILEAYPDVPGMLSANLIRTMVRYIKDNPDTDKAIMIDVLQSVDMERLRNDATAYRKIEGGTAAAAMIRVIEKRYKSKFKADKK